LQQSHLIVQLLRTEVRSYSFCCNKALQNYSEEELIGIFYFIDSDLVKNKNFYVAELSKMIRDYNVETQIFYGKSLFDYLGYTDIWNEVFRFSASKSFEPHSNIDTKYRFTSV
jgi:hypothetical protein